MATVSLPSRRNRSAVKPQPQEEPAIDVEVVDGEEETQEEAPKTRRARKTAKAEKPKVETKKTSKSTAVTTSSGIEGFNVDLTPDDFDIPTLKILHPMSKEFSDFSEAMGQFLYSGQYPLGKEIEVVIIDVNKKYQEVTDGDDDDFGETFDTQEEARAEGVRVRPFGIVDMLIAIPDDSDAADVATVDSEDDGLFVVARWYLRSNYRKFMGPLSQLLKKSGASNTWSNYFVIEAKERKVKKGKSFETLVTIGEETSDHIRSVVESFRS